MVFGTKPSGKWGARILIASSNGPFSMFFCRPSLPPAALAARLSFTTKAANIQFTLPGRLPRPSARRRAGPDSSRMQARNVVIPSSISTMGPRAASLSSSSSSATACLAACKAAIARDSDLFCFATSSAWRSASYVHISDIRLLTCRQNSTRFSLGTRASSASCRSTSAPSSAPATSSHRCPSTIARCSAAPTSSHRRRARSSGASSSPFSVFVTPSHRHHRRFEGGWRGQSTSTVEDVLRLAGRAPALRRCYRRGVTARASATTLPASVSILAQYAAQASISLRRLSNKSPRR